MISTIGFALFSLAALFPSSVSGAIVKRSADDSSLCTYTFNVVASPGEACPSSAPSDDALDEIQASLAYLNSWRSDLDSWRSDLNSWRIDLNSRLADAVTYKRWGRKDCPDTARLVYEGTYTKVYLINCAIS